MATTIEKIINGAARLIGIKGRGLSLSGEDTASALEALNAMLGIWSADNLPIYASTVENFPLVAGQSTYTIGTGGDFSTTAPEHIRAMYIRVNDVDYPVNPMTGERYALESSKSVDGRPERYWYNPTHPLGTIYFDRQPDTTDSVYIHSLKALETYTGLSDSFDLPPGYEIAVKYNLAMILADEYQRPVTQTVFKTATDSLESIKRRNHRVPTMEFPASLTPSTFDINTG